MKHKQIIAQWNKDINGNSYAIDITETLVVSPINYQIQLRQIPYELTGVQVLSPENMIECFDVDNINPLNYKVVSYCDRRVQLHQCMSGRTIVVKYKGLGVEYLSASSVYALTDANGNVLKTLGDVIDEATIQLELIKTLGDSVVIINQLNQVVHSADVLDESLRGLIDVGNPLNDSLEAIVPQAQIIEPKLKTQVVEANRINPIITANNTEANRINPILINTIATATDIDNKISSTGAKSIQVTSAMWGSIQSDGKYHYLWKHNCASQALNIDVYEVTQNGLALATMQGYIKDNNTLELITEEITECVVVCSARYYGGQIPSLISFNTDNLVEGNNKYVQSKSYDVLANQFTLVEGLYECILTHSLNRKLFSNKLAFVNEKEIVVGFDEISNTQIKIINTVAENCKIVLQWNGGM